MDELYAYDELYRLTGAERGNLNVAKDGMVSGSENLVQLWNLDPTGNWAGFLEDSDADGTNEGAVWETLPQGVYW